MTVPIRPQRERINPREYARMLNAGYSREEIEAAYDVPSTGEMVTGAVRSPEFREKSTGSVAAVLGGSTAPVAAGIARSIPATSRVGRMAKDALAALAGGSQNTKQGFKEGVKRLGANVSSNAVMGGVSSAVAGNDPLTGAAIGAGLGVLPSIPEAAVGSKNAVMNKISPTAGRRLQRAASSDAGDLLAAARARAASDPDAILADVTESHGTGLLESAVRGGGREGSRTRDALRARAEQAVNPRAVVRDVADAAGINPNQGVMGAKAEVDAAKRPAIREKFKSSVDDASEFYDDPRLKALLEQDDPEIQKAAKRAYAFVQTNRAAKGSKVERTSTGEPVYRGADFYDRLRKELGDIEQSYRGGSNPDIGAANAVKLRKQEVEEILKGRGGLGPDYEPGIRLSSENSSVQEAFDRGAALARGGDDAIKDADLIFSRELEMANPAGPGSNTEIQGAMRQGAAHEIVNQLERAKTPEALLDILASSPQQERILEFAITDPGARDGLLRDLNARLEKLYRANRLAGAAPVQQLEHPDAFGNLTPWAVASAMRGSPALAAAQGAGTWMNQLENRVRRGSTEELARLARERLALPDGSLNTTVERALTDRGRRQTIDPKRAGQAALLRLGITTQRNNEGRDR